MLFRLKRSTDPRAQSIAGFGVRLQPLTLQDFEAWASLRSESRAELEPFEPLWAADELTYQAFVRRVRVADRDRLHDLGYAYLIFTDDISQRLVGGITLSNVQRGISQSANLGYWLGSRFKGRGYMTAAGRLVQRHAFEKLSLYRLDAAAMPHNTASRRVLHKLGFEAIGLAREYLAINGQWADHELFQSRKSVWIAQASPSESLGFEKRSTA